MQGASVVVARGAGDTDTMKGAAKRHDPFNDLVRFQRGNGLHALRHNLSKTALHIEGLILLQHVIAGTRELVRQCLGGND